MSDIIDELFGDELTILESLKDYRIELGVLEEDGRKTIKIDIVNLDGTKSDVEMSVGDIMYFTEHGTLKFPARNVLENCFVVVNNMIDLELNSIIEDILENGLQESDIDNRFRNLCFRIEQYARTFFISETSKINNLSEMLGQDDQNEYLYSLNSLSNYITCKFFKK